MFLGDLVDRGPNTPNVVRLVQGMVEAGTALCVTGNHENKLVRKLSGRDVQMTHGLPETMAQLEGESEQSLEDLRGLPRRTAQPLRPGRRQAGGGARRSPGRIPRTGLGAGPELALYGETTGEQTSTACRSATTGRPTTGVTAMVVYGHTPVPEAEWVNRTICIDTGASSAGNSPLSAIPRTNLVSVDAAKVYYEPVRPLDSQTERGDLLDITDVTGKRIVETSLGGPDHHPRGELGCRPRDHEPLRGRSPLDHLPSPDHVARGDFRAGWIPRASRRSVRLLLKARSGSGRLRSQAHGFPCNRHRRPGMPRAQPNASRLRTAQPGRSSPEPDGPSSTRERRPRK